MNMAEIVAGESSAVRLKVGSVLAKDGSVIEFGYNGTLPGFSNICEYEQAGELVSKSEVVHSEQNLLMKCAKLGKATNKAILYVTHAPCLECSKNIVAAGISTVIYKEIYRSEEGINLLLKAGVEVRKL